MQKYNLTLDNSRIVSMTVLDGHNIAEEISKYEASLPTESNDYNLSMFGNPLPKKVLNFIQIS